MGMHLLDDPQPLNHSLIEIDKLRLGEVVDVDSHTPVHNSDFVSSILRDCREANFSAGKGPPPPASSRLRSLQKSTASKECP